MCEVPVDGGAGDAGPGGDLRDGVAALAGRSTGATSVFT
jgi:hypothetical protein